MNPPLREPEDVEAIRQGLKDGTLDAIASDHAPHHYDAKERDFDDAPNGIVGLETAFGLGVTELVRRNTLTLPQLIQRMSSEPARVFRLPGGTLKRGAPADVVVLDPDAHWVVDPSSFRSRSRNSPFVGRQLVGRVERTLVGGVTVFKRA
jgi:dihydroorotase